MPLNGQQHSSSVSWPLSQSVSWPFSDALGNGEGGHFLAECVELIAAAKQTNFCFCARPSVRQSSVRWKMYGARPTVKFVGRERDSGREREREREKPQFLQECKDERGAAGRKEGRKEGKKGFWTLEDGLETFFARFSSAFLLPKSRTSAADMLVFLPLANKTSGREERRGRKETAPPPPPPQ